MDITTVIINFQTPDLLEIAVKSFKKNYPKQLLLIIDNGSDDENRSKKVIDECCNTYESTEAIFLDKNIFHGPAMDLAIRKYVHTKYVFFLDSDTETKRDNFLEKMFEIIESNKKTYGVGEIIKINKRGYKSENGDKILLTPYMLLNIELYKKLTPFIHHGQPTIHNFKEAQQKGLKLVEFKISEYIDHLWRGTASKFGYGLGLKAKLDFILNKIGI